MYELLLLSVAFSTGYLGPSILRRFGPHQRVYGLMLVADLVLALYALIEESANGRSAAARGVGFVSIGAAFCLIMLPAMLRDLGRRHMAKDRLRFAKALAELRELLQPGMGASSEIELIETVLAVREGREQDIVDELKERKAEIDDPIGRRIVEERVVMTYLYAQRWAAAIEEYERMHGRHERPGPPQLVVEMVRAYCENGDLEEAAQLMQRIEDSPLSKEPALEPMVFRARMVFLAFLGRTGAVESLLAPGGPLAHMPAAARAYWTGIARTAAGDATGARTALGEAVLLSAKDKRACALATAHLARIDEPGALGPHSVPVAVGELADTLTVAVKERRHLGDAPEDTGPTLPRLSGVPMRAMPVTVTMAAANIAASAAVFWGLGSITDLGSLVAAGANLKSATVAGEWWRMASSMFLHVGLAHLFLNVYGLWVLGRLVEQMQGSLRTLAIYALAGLSGALASTYLGGAATSVGASGAVVGLMGAAIAELGIYRSRYPRAWARPLFGMLVLLSAAQLAVGFFYAIVDQWGHVGGFLGGALATALLSRSGESLRTLRKYVAALVVAAALSALAFSALSVATTNYTDTLRGYERRPVAVGGLVADVPNAWELVSKYELYDSGVGALLELRRLPAEEGLDAAISKKLEEEHLGGALRAGFDRAKPAARSRLALPEPWRGGELEVSVDGESGPQRFRLVVFGRVVDTEIWLGSYYHPAALTDAIAPVLAEVLQSLRPLQSETPAE